MLLKASQTAVATYRYDPFGRTLTSNGSPSMANTLRFSSKPVHNASGLYDYGYRWYFPNLQRWIRRDPIGERGGVNVYGFVDNAPIGSVDPTGDSQCRPHPPLVVALGEGHQFAIPIVRARPT